MNIMQDSIKTDKFSYKTNAISLYGMNDQLKKLCVDNRGKYISVMGPEAKDIKEFEG